MKKRIYSVLLAAILVLSTIPALAENTTLLPNADYAPNTPVTFIVEVEGDAALAAEQANAIGARAYFATREKEIRTEQALANQESVLCSIQEDVSETAKKGYTYTLLFNGFSMDGHYGDLQELQEIPGVKNVYISGEHQVPQPAMSAAADMTGIPQLWENNTLKGQGELIAIIDSEFATDHAFFQTAPENPRYSKQDICALFPEEGDGQDAKKTGSAVYKSEKIPFAYDYVNHSGDTRKLATDQAHGTHVAGIAAGKNGTLANGELFSGVAPEAQLALMKVSKANGSISDADVLIAMEDAAKLGVSAMNLSFTVNYAATEQVSIYQTPIANARNAGIFVSVSAGNSSRGYQQGNISPKHIDYRAAGTPGIFPGATAIASVDNMTGTIPTGVLTLSDGTELTYQEAWDGAAFYDTLGGQTQEYVFCNYGTAADFAATSVLGKLALVKRGNLSFADKASNAHAAGATGLIIWDNQKSTIHTVELAIPACIVSPRTGDQLWAAAEKKLSIAPPVLRPVLSYFSSWSTAESLELKPELSAPGGMIYSSYALADTPYASLSGTSMSAPFVAGTAALLSQFFAQTPRYASLDGFAKTELMESLLMSTATIIRQANGIPESPRRQGAGLINPEAAIKTPAVLLGPDGDTKISLGASTASDFSLKFTVKNFSDTPVSYKVSGVDVLTDQAKKIDQTYYITDQRRLAADYTAPQTITVPANSETPVEISVSVSQSALAENLQIFTNGFFIDGFVHLENTDALLPSLQIPYTKFHGDWQAVPLFDDTRYGKESALYIPGNTATMGTFLQSIFGDYLRPLGQYRLSDNGTMQDLDQAMIHQNYIALSPNGDGLADTFGIQIQPMRNVGNTLITIVAADGTVQKRYDAGMLRKFAQASFSKLDISDLEDGQYSVIVTGCLLDESGDTTPDDSFRLPLVIDRSAPTVLCASLSQDKTQLTLTATDNHYLQGICVYDATAGEDDGTTQAVNHATTAFGKDDAMLVFDVAGIPEENIRIKVYDYAMNSTKYRLDQLTFPIASEFLSATDSTTTFRIYNCTDGKNLIPLLAFYANDGSLLQISKGETALSADTQAYTISAPAPTQAQFMRLFIWDGFQTLAPLSHSDVYSRTGNVD